MVASSQTSRCAHPRAQPPRTPCAAPASRARRARGGASGVRLSTRRGGGFLACWSRLRSKCERGAPQVYMPKEVAEPHGGKDLLKTGASLLVRGTLAATPPEVQQAVELRASEVLHFGPCDPKTYPMAKKKHGMEFLRDKAHLRPRTNVIGAVARIRSQLAYATHQFFQQHGFLYVHTPIITASDCEGAGEMFQVTTLLGEAETRTEADEGAGASASGQDTGADVALEAERQVRGIRAVRGQGRLQLRRAQRWVP